MDAFNFANCGKIIPLILVSLLMGCAHFPVLIVHHDPLSAKEHTQLGLTYQAQGLPKNAADQYQSALKKDSTYVPAWMAFGDISFDLGDFKNAERSFRRVLKITPHDAKACNNLAMVYLAQNIKLDKAEYLAKEALSESGPSLKPYILDTLNHIDLRLKNFPKENNVLDKAVEPSSNDILRKGPQFQ